MRKYVSNAWHTAVNQEKVSLSALTFSPALLEGER